MGSPVIRTRELIKTFGSVVALNRLDLQVPRGISGLIGPNGAGKTTTINILMGLLKPDYGRAEVLGFDCWRESYEVRRRTGLLRENPGYPGELTGLRYLELVARVRGVQRPRAEALRWLREVGLYRDRHRPIKTYSAGMKQRLGLAQALVGEPELVMLDEPTAHLDPLGRMALLSKVKELNVDHGISFLVSTHILPELEEVCSWVSIIKDGMIVEQGRMPDLARKYSADVYVIRVPDARLLASRLSDIGCADLIDVGTDTIRCRVRDLRAFYEGLSRALGELGLHLIELRLEACRLTEIFRRLVG